MTSDKQIGAAVIHRVLRNEVEQSVGNADSFLPEATSLANQDAEKLSVQLADTIRIIGDHLASQRILNDLIDGIPQPDERFLSKLATKVFADGNVNWGRIVVLFYTVAKLAVKFVKAHFPESVQTVLRWTQTYFKENLLNWIIQAGGWINSISEFTCLRMTGLPSLSASQFLTTPVVLITVFACGFLLGAVWRICKNT
ncbi:apoptosis regulator BAX-like [Denticeps clupeoides]|uniref:apoptosis regulator BAX-like n=1 Tax=Denticeps clupeoides TaxID=299321 RepID=UPI0010A3133B|nr:apoptosis regulator BAX-like [Denticeps clupeoides]